MQRLFADEHIACVSIASATVLAMVNIGITRPGYGDTFAVTPSTYTDLAKAASAISSIVLAYNGHIAYPTIIDEMRTPTDFPKAIILLESVTISFYIIVAVVIYNFAGQGVAAPALGSASPLIRKIAYGIAIPTIIVAGVIVALVAAKQIYKHVWYKQPKIMEEKWTLRANGSWIAIAAAVWIAAFIIAGVIPIFGSLIGLIGALFGTWFSLGFCSMFWLSMNWKGSLRNSYRIDWKKTTLTVANVLIVLISAALVSAL